MATTIATVTTDGLSLSPEIMEELNLRPGSKVRIPLEKERTLPSMAEGQRLIRETMGIFADTPGLSADLKQDRLEEDRRSRW